MRFVFVSVLTIQLFVCFASVAHATILSFGPSAALNSNAATDSGVDHMPQLTPDGAGNWVAVWDSTDSLGSTIGADNPLGIAFLKCFATPRWGAGPGNHDKFLTSATLSWRTITGTSEGSSIQVMKRVIRTSFTRQFGLALGEEVDTTKEPE